MDAGWQAAQNAATVSPSETVVLKFFVSLQILIFVNPSQIVLTCR